MAFPTTPLSVTVEIFYDAAWNDITAYVYHRDLIRIRRGLSNEAIRADPQTCRLTLNNRDGRFSPRNPIGALYGKIVLNTQLRVTVDPGTGVSVRFVGEVAKWPPRWDVAGADVWVPIEAAGITRRLGQTGSLRSPMYRTHSGVSANDLAPAHYMPLEDGSDAMFFAEVMNGTSVAIPSAVTPAADDTLAGSLPLPQFASGAHLSVVVPSYSPTTQWHQQFTVKMPASQPASNVTLWEGAVSNAGGGVASMRLILDVTDALIDTLLSLQALDDSGAVVATASKSIDPLASISPDDFYGSWRSIIVGMQPNGANYQIDLALTETGTTFNGYFTAAVSGSIGVLRSFTLRNTGTQTVTFGHAALFGGSFDINVEGSQNASSMLGHAGEMVHTRISRLCQEEQVTVTVTGTSTTAMGPQSVGTLLELLDDCATVDAGILYEPRDSLGLAYRTRSSRYNQAVDLSLDYTAEGHVPPPLEPVEDDQGVVNDATVTRTGGSSGRYELTTGRMSTQDPPDGIGRYQLSETHNLYDDTQPFQHAAWLVNRSAVDEERYPSIRVDLAAAASNGATTVVSGAAAVDVGDRLTIDNLPAWLGTTSADQHALGYDETIGLYGWEFVYNCVPASPYDVAVYGSASTVSRYDSASSELAAAATSSATSLLVSTGMVDGVHDPVLWVTGSSAPTFPLDVKVSGLVYAVSAIASAVMDTFSRTVSDGWGSPDTGPAWSVLEGPASDISVSGGTGRHSISAAGAGRSTYLDVAWADVDITILNFGWPVLPTGGNGEQSVRLRRIDGSNFIELRISRTTANTSTITLRHMAAGVDTLSSSLAVSGATATSNISVRLAAVGSVLRAKAWIAGATQPTWLLEMTGATLLTGGQVLLRSTISGASTNVFPIVSTFDNVTVANPQTFTVTRLATDKALAAAEPVHVHPQARYAL